MHKRRRQRLALLGIFAILMHGLLWGLAATAAAAADSFDPLAIICHNGPDAAATGDQAPASKPSAACDHCNLCGATASALAPDFVIAGRLLPPRPLVVLRPASVDERSTIVSRARLARGPPQQA